MAVVEDISSDMISLLGPYAIDDYLGFLGATLELIDLHRRM
jgi:hypothetical protein